MSRARSGKIHSQKRKSVLKDAKGYIGARSVLYRTAKDARRRALENAYRDRRRRKRDFRSLWIVRISAAAKLCGISYSKLIGGMAKADIAINRKMLADIAVRDMETFRKIVDKVQEAA